jgi:hypothetical protein
MPRNDGRPPRSDGSHPNSRKNLKPPWKKGESGGGGPSPKPRTLTMHLRKLLESDDEKEAVELARAILDHAKAGNAPYAKIVMDRIDGLLVQRIETEDVTPITESERAARLAEILERGRARGSGSADPDSAE